MTTFDVDQLIEWQDWTKTSWDLPPRDPDELDEYLAMRGIEPVYFASLPVFYLAAPSTPWLLDWAELNELTAAGVYDERKHPRYAKGTKIGPGGEGGGRFRGRVGVTPFRPEDDPEGFFETEKFRAFEQGVGESAKQHGVTIDEMERVHGFWMGEQEPSLAIEAHDGEEGVRAFAEDVRSDWDQDGVLTFGYDENGDALAFMLHDVTPDVAASALTQAGIQGATIHPRSIEVFGDDAMIDQIEALRASLGIAPQNVVVKRGKFELVER